MKIIISLTPSLRQRFLLILLTFLSTVYAQQPLTISDPETWTTAQLSAYVGQTVRMTNDWYLCSNYNRYYISPRRIFSPTNQAYPLSAEYSTLLSLNQQGTVRLSGVSEYHRTGEKLHNLIVHVNSTGELSFVSGEWVGNSRADILQGYDIQAIDKNGTHTMLVCGANLEYYLVDNLGTGFGPDNYTQHQAQRQKVSQALALIKADIYGLMEVERGQAALQEIAADLSQRTGKKYTYIDDGGSAYGSYTKSGFVYCSETVRPYSTLRANNTGVISRKYMQCFEEIASGERFILSINHFKAKSGSGTGQNADQGDGQGIFNADRIKEAQSVLSEYNYWRVYVQEADLLIMGDLNAYAKEDPITVLTDGGMTDLHRYFHADSSYSYTYRSEAGYLDHALCNTTMLGQVTGMQALHINADERDSYTYDGYDNDGTMFRYSDHDPILVGLGLGTQTSTHTDVYYEPATTTNGQHIVIQNATGGKARIYALNGLCLSTTDIPNDYFTLPTANLPEGLLILHIYYNGEVLQRKLIIDN